MAETLAIDRIHKTFEELETQKSLISTCILQWKKLSDHYSNIEKNLTKRSQTIDSKLESLDSQTKQAILSIEQQETSLPRRESSAVALIDDRRFSVIAEMENPEYIPPRNLSGIVRWYCRRMDAPGLWRFLVSRQKEIEILRRELSGAVSDAVDPPRLVLDAVDDFMSSPAAAAAAAVTNVGEKYWAIGALVKVLFDLVGKKAEGVSDSIRDRAAAVAESWRGKFVGKEAEEHAEADNKVEGDKKVMEGAEARIFLRMVIAFGLRSKFEDDFLLKLVIENSTRKEIAKHALKLGFGEKVEEVIALIKNGKEIDAIYMAHESGLLDKFSPVPLLKYHLNSKRNANAVGANNLELKCIKSIIKCVETLNLEQKFTLETLKKRATDLETGMAVRKRKQESRQPQTKRSKPRSGKGHRNFRSSKRSRNSRSPYPPYSQNPPVASRVPPARQSYNYAPQARFDIRPSASYGAASHRSPPMPQYYVPDNIASVRNTIPYVAPAVNYGSYDYNGPPAPPQYQQ